MLEKIVQTTQMALELFAVCTIRTYEDLIIATPNEYTKKVEPIAQVLRDKFASPSLPTIYELARHCYYLVDAKAPDGLRKMRQCLETTFTLGPIGELLSDLEVIFPPEGSKPRTINKPSIIKPFFTYTLHELSKFATRANDVQRTIESMDSDFVAESHRWVEALRQLVSVLEPIFSQTFVLETVEQQTSAGQEYLIVTKTYGDGRIGASTRQVSFNSLDAYDTNTSAVALASAQGPMLLRLFPFLVIKDDRLFFYARTRFAGYEYRSLHSNNVHIMRVAAVLTASALRKTKSDKKRNQSND